MEKILRFRNRAFDNVYYPLSRLKGLSRSTAKLVFHFDPLKNSGTSDTDKVEILFTDAGVHPLAVTNFYKAVYGSKKTIVTVVDVASVNDGETVPRDKHVFGVDNDDANMSQYFNTTSITDFCSITIAP